MDVLQGSAYEHGREGLPLAALHNPYDKPPERPGLTRRQFFGAGFVGSVTLATQLARANEYAGDMLTSATQTTYSLKSAAEELHQGIPTAFLIFPGFNASPETLERYLAPVFTPYGDCITAWYGTDILSSKQLAAHLHSALESSRGGNNRTSQPSSIIAFAHSAGGIISRPILRELKLQGHDVRGVVLDCTPASIEDVGSATKQAMVKAMALADELDIQGGPLSRTVFEAIGHGVDTKNPFFIQDLFYGIKRAAPKGSVHENEVIQKTAVAIARAKYTMHLEDDPLAAVPHAIFGPAQSSNDRVIRKAASRSHWRAIAPAIQMIDVPGGTHGISRRTKNFYAKKIQEILGMYGVETTHARNQQLRDLGWPRQVV